LARTGSRTIALVILAAFSSTALAGAVASSFKKETRKGANYWNAQAAIDGNPATCWMVPGESPNRGESITLDVPRSSVDKIGMIVGWARDDDTFKDYARIKEVQIEAYKYNENNDLVPTGKTNAKFEDKMDMQVVDIDDLKVGDDLLGGKVKITVVDIYEGRDYPNMAMSEVLLHLTEFEAPTVIKEVSSEADGHARENLVDDNVKTWWQGDAEGASFMVDASGYSLSQVGLLPGPADYARPKKVEVEANGRTTVTDFPDTPDEKWVLIPAIVGYTGSAWGKIHIKVLETWPGKKYADQLALSELDLKATAYEGI